MHRLLSSISINNLANRQVKGSLFQMFQQKTETKTFLTLTAKMGNRCWDYYKSLLRFCPFFR